MSERIDSHHHLWRYDKSEYGWIGEDMSLLARDYLPENLRPELVESGIQGTVAVQTRQTLAETRFLLDFAEEFEFIRGVVGWAPIATAEFLEVLERLKGYTKLKGLRHVIQDELDDQFILRDDFNSGIGLLKRYSLVYDILIYEKHLPAAISFVDRHPSQIFVLDHIGKPRIRAGEIEPWRTNLQSLARRENVFCKLSGLVTEADWKHWQIADLRPYLDVVLGAFGARRLMVGSDWPVCLLASTPKKWFCTLKEFLRPLSVSEQDMILGGVASKVYSLG
ncbi:MAG TPA: amidohydrolase family protein [Candidatus Acidoferrum sp.]|nr:amidohydrolase family protein [Candidatus Acidoferrum sp.]